MPLAGARRAGWRGGSSAVAPGRRSRWSVSRSRRGSARVGRLSLNVLALGFANGVFAVAAIGAMMGLAGSGGGGREGIRMGVWGAAQAIAFGLGGLIGAVGVDVGRALTGSVPDTFAIVFAAEGLLFLAAATLALRNGERPSSMTVSGAPA